MLFALLVSTSLIQLVGATMNVPTYMISSRGNLVYEGLEGKGYGGNYSFLNITKLFESCPSEVAIFVHGWDNDEYRAKERLDRVKMSLEHNNYNLSLIGFSWNSNVDWQPAKLIAKENGPKLSQFVLDLESNCDDIVIRLIGHSLGARVILSTLDELHNNPSLNNSGFKIASVHLMGSCCRRRGSNQKSSGHN